MPLCPTEARLVEGITDLLATEPFDVSPGELLHGFTACVVVRLKDGINLQTSTGEPWNPVLVIEPSGGANDNFPRRQLFTRLKHEFFRHAHGITVQTVPVAALMGKGRSLLRERLLELPDLLHALYPPSMEDATNFSASLHAMGLTGPEGILSSLNRSLDPSPRASPLVGAASSSLFSGGAPNAFGAGPNGDEPCDGSLECCLDFHETAPYTAMQRSLLTSSCMQQGMALRWIGDVPVVKPCSPSPHPRTLPAGRVPAALPGAEISVLPVIPGGGGANGNSNSVKAASELASAAVSTSAAAAAATGAIAAAAIQHLSAPRNLRALQGQPKPPAFRSSTAQPVGASPAAGSATDDVATEGRDKDIEELEAELEIARLQAKLLRLRCVIFSFFDFAVLTPSLSS